MKHFLILTAAVSALTLSSCAEAGPTTSMTEAEVQALVKDYILENPEIIGEALERLEAKLRQAQITDNADAIFNDPRDYSIGPKDAKVQFVEFYDYNCGFCKRSVDYVEEIIEKYPNDVRVIFKELPVLDRQGGSSRLAAKASLAAARQGKFLEMHTALMDERGFTQEKINEIAESVGLNVAKLEADMKEPALELHINDTLSLAAQMPDLTGTPFFIVNEQFVSGANIGRVEEMLQEELSRS